MRPDRGDQRAAGTDRRSFRIRSRIPLAPTLAPTLALTLVLTAAAVPAGAQWSTQSPVPTDLDVRGVAAPTAGHVLIATDDDSFDDGGALFESQDAGATWVQRDVPPSLGSPLNGIFFRDDKHGWVYGNENLRTTDGGVTWLEMPFLGSTYFMRFYTAGFGLATGNFGRYTSQDGGQSWNPEPNDIFAFDFVDPLNGLGVAETGVYLSTDGGASFAPVQAGDAAAAVFLDASVAVAIVDGSFWRSEDGGQTWTPGDPAQERSRLTAVSAGVVLAWGRAGSFPDYDDRVLRSQDGGQTWTDLGEPVPAGIVDLVVPDPTTVVAADLQGGMHRSADAGASWDQTFTSPGPAPGFLSSAVPVFADALTGYYGYGAGFVIGTTDGGQSWSQISSGTGRSLSDLDRFPAGQLLAVGEQGTLLRGDGTGPWTLSPPPTGQDLVAAQVIGPLSAFILDETGQVFGTSDGGDTWTPAPTSPPNLDAADLHFKGLLDGWVVGSGPIGGALYHTLDGGATWDPAGDFGGSYVAVDFADVSGWVLNVGGVYQRSIDAGETWTEGTLPGSPFQLADLDFFDPSIGYVVGRDGYAARSDDGGATWQVLPTPNASDDFTDIYLVGANELWLSTNNDRAYYTATGGQNWAVLEIGSSGFGNFAAIAASAEGDAWTAGFQGYIEHFTGPPPPPLNRPPAASFEFETTGLTVDFTDTSEDPDGIITDWAWDFGDSTTSSEPSPSHTFGEADTYIVRLTVTDDDGDTGSAARFIVVQPGPGGTFGDFVEVTPLDPLFVTPQDEDFWVVATAPADYDADGDLDIAVFGYYVVYNESVEERLVLFRNDGPAGPEEWEFSYVEVPVGTLSAGTSDLAWGDADGDGDQDLVVGSFGQTVLYRNDAGVLVPTETALPGYYEDNDQADFDLRSITWADYDNDGDEDLLLPSVFDGGSFSYRTALMRNDGPDGNGGIIFTETDSVFAPTRHAQSAWADYDGDEDLDLLLIHVAPLTDDGFIRRYRNEGDGSFVAEDILGELTIEHGEGQWGDYDADGDLDVLIAGHIKETDGSFTQALRIYRNDAETYVPVEVIENVPGDGWFDLTAGTWADYDTDGDMDILLAGTYNSGSNIEGRARIYGNDNGVFFDAGTDLPAPRASGSRGGTFSWLDLDGDGDLDYFIAGQYFVPGGNGLVEAQMHAYLNGAAGQNAVPSAPSDLDAIVQRGDVLLSWTGATDDHTPAAQLTYELGLFRDGAPVQVPEHTPVPGNLSAASQWRLAGLPDGLYTWSLRAIDSAYNAGPVATGSFGIGDITGLEPGGGLPRAFAFEDNFPNPFNPSTTFRFALPEQARVELTVYDLKGRLVTRLLREVRPAGVHELRWEPRNLASGTYLVRLVTPGFASTRRVSLVK